MQRRVNRDDFRRSAEIGHRIHEGSYWSVADDYEIKGEDIVPRPRRDENGRPIWWAYKPLEDAPDLFLKFARLNEVADFEASALDWCRAYGLPGTSVRNRAEMSLDRFVSDSAAFGMSVSDFREEVERAWHVLTMYEAVLNEDVATALKFLSPEILIHHQSDRTAGQETGGKPLQEVLHSACWQVTLMLHDLCFPFVQVGSMDTLKVRTFWHFHNLLGAMYLQMYWLMVSGEELSRCQYCRQIISLARSHPDGRKPPRHKRFCNAACRQANYRSKRKD